MHRCLDLQEILTNIFLDYVYWERHNEPRLDTRFLLNLATTCKAFYEPAITLLWCYQNSLVPLLRCFPSDAYTEQQRGGSRLLIISRDLTSSDFDSIRYYAQKIKYLDETNYMKYDWSLQALIAHLPNGLESAKRLLPNLRHIALREDKFHGTAVYPHLFVGPHLESVLIKAGFGFRSTESWGNIETIYMPYASTLKSFAIDDCTYNTHSHNFNHDQNYPILQLYSNFHELIYLQTRVVKLDNDALIRISTLPKLQTLDIRPCDFGSLSIPQLSLDHLTDLTLTFKDFIDIYTFLTSASFKHLCAIRIERDRTSIPSCQVMFETLSDRFRDCPLVSITLTIESIFSFRDIIPTTITKADLKPLLVFPHISTLVIDYCSTAQLDDAALMELSRAWPKLRILRLGDRKEYSLGQYPSVTTAGMISFATSCPALESLALRFNAREIPKYATFHALSSIPSHLRRLDISCSPIADFSNVTELLIMAFPKLQEFHVDGMQCNYKCRCDFKSLRLDWREVAINLREILSRRSSSLQLS